MLYASKRTHVHIKKWWGWITTLFWLFSVLLSPTLVHRIHILEQNLCLFTVLFVNNFFKLLFDKNRFSNAMTSNVGQHFWTCSKRANIVGQHFFESPTSCGYAQTVQHCWPTMLVQFAPALTEFTIFATVGKYFTRILIELKLILNKNTLQS